MGVLNLNQDPNFFQQTAEVDHLKIHPDFIHNLNVGLPNDIALIKLPNLATLNKNVKIASLAEKDDDFLGGKCVVAGWGITSTGKTPRRLKEVSVNYVKMEFISPILLKAGKC